MGEVRSLNLWLSLSRCGDVAPGLDIVPRRFDHFVTTQTDEALLDYMISQRMAEEAAGETPIMRPIFEPGDALLFDDMFLHKTGSDPVDAASRGSRSRTGSSAPPGSRTGTPRSRSRPGLAAQVDRGGLAIAGHGERSCVSRTIWRDVV